MTEYFLYNRWCGNLKISGFLFNEIIIDIILLFFIDIFSLLCHMGKDAKERLTLTYPSSVLLFYSSYLRFFYSSFFHFCFDRKFSSSSLPMSTNVEKTKEKGLLQGKQKFFRLWKKIVFVFFSTKNRNKN